MAIGSTMNSAVISLNKGMPYDGQIGLGSARGYTEINQDTIAPFLGDWIRILSVPVVVSPGDVLIYVVSPGDVLIFAGLALAAFHVYLGGWRSKIKN